ncbi:N-acetyltransferase [Nocardiopsis sp. CC223A]|uniref:GNAT family N-acetyltransferase n=1 Tax=Nocardiopsis sp. CC223A TaxID=3044051 RepID=UPI00278BDC3C|nr:GNAT family N-acetyltransferase [Nocardiopsis sp. CC223A]
MTSTLTRTVRTATMDDLPGVARVLGRAFHTDPLFLWLFPDDMRRIAQGTRAGALLAGFTYIPPGYSTLVEAREDADRGPVIRGAALWEPPSGEGRGPAAALRSLPHWLELVGPARFPRVLRYFAELAAHAPREPHWHLHVLGADPAVGRSGVGSMLLNAGLERADADGAPVYLETMNPANLGYYERFDFRVVRVLNDSRYPSTYCLLRDSAA